MQALSEYTKLSIICSFHLTSKIIMKIYKKLIRFTTSFNQLHGDQAIRNTYHTRLQATPYYLVFGRDMIHNIALRANWYQIKKENRNF
jgi:hypothetical protein